MSLRQLKKESEGVSLKTLVSLQPLPLVNLKEEEGRLQWKELLQTLVREATDKINDTK